MCYCQALILATAGGRVAGDLVDGLSNDGIFVGRAGDDDVVGDAELPRRPRNRLRGPDDAVVDQEFSAAVLGDTTFTFKPAFGIVEEQPTLRERPPVTSTLKHSESLSVTVRFKQGHDGALAEGTFDISMAGKMDIVIVIDDSSSMDSEQAVLQQGLSNLLSSLTNVDWQIAVSTSDASEPCIRDEQDIANGTAIGAGTILKKADYDRDPAAVTAAYMALISAGTNGDSNERTLYGARRAFDPSVQAACKPNSWVRKDSALAVLVVTDEDNCHQSNELNFHHTSVNKTSASDPEFVADYDDKTQDGCSASEYSGAELLGTFARLNRTPGKDARVYDIFWPRGTDVLALRAASRGPRARRTSAGPTRTSSLLPARNRLWVHPFSQSGGRAAASCSRRAKARAASKGLSGISIPTDGQAPNAAISGRNANGAGNGQARLPRGKRTRSSRAAEGRGPNVSFLDTQAPLTRPFTALTERP